MQDTVAVDGEGQSIAQARHRAIDFLTRLQAEHGLPVSARVLDPTQILMTELVTNVLKYAPGPLLLELRIVGAVLEATVWDGDPVLSMARRRSGPSGVARSGGRHGLRPGLRGPVGDGRQVAAAPAAPGVPECGRGASSSAHGAASRPGR